VLGGCGFYADDLRIQVMPAAGHLLAEECPQPVAAAVRAFLQCGGIIADGPGHRPS